MTDKIGSVHVTGTWYRHVPPGADPLTVREPAPDGRWQRGVEVAALYLAQDTETVWAEWYRALAELGEPPDLRLPRDLWRFDVNLASVADVSRPAVLRALGLPRPAPDRTRWPRFQAVGEWLSAEGYAGVLFRSSARPRGLSLCLFAHGRAFPGVGAIGPPERIKAAPPPPRGMRT